MASSFFRWMYNVFASFIGEIFRKLFRSQLVKELDRKMMDTSKDDEIEINSSSSSRRYDVFASFRGDDVRKSLLSHLLKELDRKSISTFRDHGIERSLQIAPALVSAIRESRIAIVIFSKNYASSSWCLNELVEIHECYKKLNQMVIPVFYDVDPSDVRKQTVEFGKVFKVTCKGKTEDQKRRWMQALSDVADMAGEDLQNWPDEAAMIEKIAIDVLNKLITPKDDFGGFVGIEAQLEAVNSMLCLESEEARMVGILGTSGIGKTTIARALFSQHSSKFHYRAFITYKRTIRDDYGMKLYWEEQFLSTILGQKDLKIEHLGMVERRLKHKKVLIVLDDVDDLELLKTLVGQTGWFGSGRVSLMRNKVSPRSLALCIYLSGLPLENFHHFSLPSPRVSSSSLSRRYHHVFPSFKGEDVRKTLLSHLYNKLKTKAITTFIDDQEIEMRSMTIGPSLILAIRNSRISVVIFSKNYAASSWCLDELVEIHASYKKLDQMVIPVFYDVDPSEVRKQTRPFGKVFEVTCSMGIPDDHKQRWVQALTDVANIAGVDSRNWRNEADLIENIVANISKTLTSSNFVDELVGLEAHKGNEFNIRKGGW